MALQGANGRGLEAPEDGTRLVILIDALDELPSWLCVFITTRPEVEISFFAHAVSSFSSVQSMRSSVCHL